MGIYDRDYYRDDEDGFWSNLGGRGVVWMIGITVGVFILQLLTRDVRTGTDPFTVWGAFDPAFVTGGQVWRLLTASFVNNPWTPSTLISLLFGMYFLYMLGSQVEGIYGKREFIAYYIASGLVSTLSMLVIYLLFWRGAPVANPSYGPGPAITAILVLFACHFPTQKILLMFVIPVPVWLLVAGTVVLSTMGFFGSRGALEFAGTLGAVGFGFLYYWQQWRITGVLGELRERVRPARSSRLRVYREPENRDADSERLAPAAVPTRSRPIDEHLEAKLDQVLEKVSRYGRESLSPEENELLLRASEIYKRRREP